MPIWIVFVIITLLVFSVLYYVRFYRRHIIGENAVEQTLNVTILEKQSTPIISARVGEDNEEYWIYVQPTAGGPKREFMVGIHYYHALNSGDQGTMTYKGRDFLHFALQRS
ncbi:DUF2500 domain-containing protein [Photobacterium indicum]|uniref:DUF2500 domain-containing protein n=1 Tax=Photobacterium indicum TaxID=81447 RepID=A0A2T3L667_9GAMM|nr:DUF2500 domain-containing protein [Photobacterium indicum]PSV45616.1 DUF2500 domain-containing protein [Photobacterium indicum]